MNIQKLIKEYEEKANKIGKELKKYDGSFLGKSPTLQESIDIACLTTILLETKQKKGALKTLQTEMRGYLGRFSNKLNKANVILAFGLEEDE